MDRLHADHAGRPSLHLPAARGGRRLTRRAPRALVPVLVGALALGVALAACGSSSPPAPPASQGLVLNRSTPQNATLVDQHGRVVSLAGLRGKVVVLAPFLSLCQDECPLVTGAFLTLRRALRAAGQADRVVFVEATVDPGRDSVARLAAYQKEFGADWELWTGTPAQVAAFWKPFGIAYQTVPEAQPAVKDWWTGQPLTYDVAHSDGYILIDPAGRERFVDASAPAMSGRLDDKLTGLLGPDGVRGLDHPQATDWTMTDALTAIGWLLGTSVAVADT